nr:reverse transcriptase domain-containing protein [Tanacetum cinerariifolium]
MDLQVKSSNDSPGLTLVVVGRVGEVLSEHVADCWDIIGAQAWLNFGSVVVSLNEFLGDMKRGQAEVCWKDVCLLKNKGGRGVQKIETVNITLMTSHIWKTIRYKDFTWVMAFSFISISSDSSKESVRTSTVRVILFGTIPTTIPPTTPTIDLPVIHDDTPLIHPLFHLFDTPNTPPSQDPYEVTVARWRSRVAARSSPPPSPIRQILPAPPGLPHRPAILVLPGQSIPVGRPYRTQPNGVLKMLTAKKSVGSLPTHRLALRYSADYSSSDLFTSYDSSRDSLLNSFSETSSDSHSDTSSYSFSRHSSSGYAISDSLRDSSTAIFTRPSPKRCRSPTSSVPVVSPVDDSYEPYIEPNIDPNVQVDIDECFSYDDAIRARGTDVGIVVETAVESSARGLTEVEVDPRVRLVIDDDMRESVKEDVPVHVTTDGGVEVIYKTLGGLVQRFHDHTMEILAHRIQVIESVQRDHRHRIVATSQQRATMSKRIDTLEQDNMRLRGITIPTATRSEMTQDAINELIAKRVEEALKAYDAAKNPRTETEIENKQQDNNVNANGENVNGNGNRNGNPNANNGGVVPVARECTYQDFMKCQPLNFKGTEGVVCLTRWFEKIKTVFHISNCPPRYQVKYATYTLLDGALTWWNSYKRTLRVDDAYAITWKALMKLMTK